MRRFIGSVLLGLAACSSDAAWVESAKRVGFTEADIRRLDRDRVLVTAETFPQVFTPYVGNNMPAFVTTDSLLNAFHVLLESSFLRFERRNARDLTQGLREWVDVLSTPSPAPFGEAETWRKARDRARTVVAIALRLMDDSAGIPEDLKSVIELEVSRVVAGQGIQRPRWMSSVDAESGELDYGRFRPQGFYASDEVLSRYFRAMAWLQAIPFWVKNDEDLLAFVVLADSVMERVQETPFARRMVDLFDRLKSFVPRGTAPDLLRTRRDLPWSDRDLRECTLTEIRASVLEWPRNKTDGLHAADVPRWSPRRHEDHLNLRIVSPALNHELEVFSVTGSPGALPEGLHVAAWLGSTRALDSISEAARHQIESVPRKPAGDHTSAYLECLAVLADGPEPDAPDFMADRAWSEKSLNTVLAGWAQFRHTLALHEAPWVNVFGHVPSPAGFVEPEPEFYARLGRLAGSMGARFSETGVLAPDLDEVIGLLRKALAILDEGHPNADSLLRLTKVFEDAHAISRELEASRKQPAGLVLFAAQCRVALSEAEGGKVPTWFPARFRVIYEAPVLEPLWRDLAEVCFRLEAIAHKQLRKMPLSSADQSLIRRYGETLHGIMMFRGSSLSSPPTARPKISTVAFDPVSGHRLQPAIGRAHALYVLYPSESGPILCRGVVIPYYEVRDAQPRTDAEWETILDSSRAPSPRLDVIRTTTKTEVPSEKR